MKTVANSTSTYKSNKTILLPIFNGLRARNFFLTDTYPMLLKAGVRLIILVPSVKLAYYEKTYGHPQVTFVPWNDTREPWLGRVLHSIAFALLDTGTIRAKQYAFYMRHKNLPKFLLQRMITVLFGNNRLLRKLIRLCDRFVPPNEDTVAMLTRYKPDLVLAPDIILSSDRITLRTAKRMGFKTVGMVRSWDNLTAKGVIQVMPDILIAQTTHMKREAIALGDMREADIVVAGVPQFDPHFKPAELSREAFLSSLGIPPARRMVLCAPFFGEYSLRSGVMLVRQLARLLDEGMLPSDVHIIVRYRPEDKTSERAPDTAMFDHPHITVTKPYSQSFRLPTGRTDFEFTKSDLSLMVNSLRYSDVTINTISTLTIDAVALDKPVINVRFDADPETPEAFRVALFSNFDHYRTLEQMGGVRLAYSLEELGTHINAYLDNPTLDSEGRARIRREHIAYCDGESGMRTGKALLRLLDEDK